MHTPRRHSQRGFTLVEQLAVITLVGATSATAVPVLVAVNARANTTTLASLAGSAATAMALNQAGCLLTGQRSTPGKCQPVRDCADVADLLMTDLPVGIQVQAGPLPTDGGRCSIVRLDDGSSASFHGVAAGG